MLVVARARYPAEVGCAGVAYWKEVRARARLDHEFSVASKHYGVWYMKVILGLPDAVIAAQAGWSEESITKMVATCGHAVDERRLDEIDAAFQVTLR